MNLKVWGSVWLGLLLSFGLVGCDEEPQSVRPISVDAEAQSDDGRQLGGREIAIDITEPADGDYDAALQEAKGLGISRIGLFQNWDTLEPEPESYFGEWLTIADLYYSSQDLGLDLTIAVYHANQMVLPADLEGKRLDDPEVIERFKRVIDYSMSQLPNTDLRSLVISSESDIALGTDAAAWAAFEGFYVEIANYVHETYPGVPVTTEFKYEGLTGPMREQALAINRVSDVIGVSYYPIQADFSVKDPAVVQADFDALVALYPDRPIAFYQYGYPSSELLNSSETLQAQFITETFLAWDRHAEQIEMIDFTWLHELSAEAVAGHTVFYEFSAEPFKAFLGSLGLKSVEGVDKPAYFQLVAEIEGRSTD